VFDGQRKFQCLAAHRSQCPDGIQFDLLEGMVRGGTLSWNSLLQTGRLPDFTWNGTVQLEKARTGPLLMDWGIEPLITGQLDWNGSFTVTEKESRLKGRFHLERGVLGPAPTLDIFVNETGFRSLRKINFRSLSGQISFSKNRIDLKHLHLISDKARLSADFTYQSGYIIGLFSMMLRKSVVKESRQLAWLMDFVGADEWMDLDFRVAGLPTHPRIEWLDSDFKRLVEIRFSHPFFRSIFVQEIQRVIAKSETTK